MFFWKSSKAEKSNSPTITCFTILSTHKIVSCSCQITLLGQANYRSTPDAAFSIKVLSMKMLSVNKKNLHSTILMKAPVSASSKIFLKIKIKCSFKAIERFLKISFSKTELFRKSCFSTMIKKLIFNQSITFGL
jgi:hypothetical protein